LTAQLAGWVALSAPEVFRGVIQADGANKYLAQLEADRTRSRFPVAVLANLTAGDVDLSVRFRPISGRVDQAAGLVWRFQNEDNYYVVRANALEDNVVWYKVENGRRSDLPVKGEGRTYGKPSQVPSGQWGTLRVVVTGSKTPPSRERARWASGPRPTRSRISTTSLWSHSRLWCGVRPGGVL